MSMREEFEKWADENWMIVDSTDDAWECWQAAYLAGAKAMQGEAAKKCDEKYKVRAEGGFPREASTARALGDEIRAINPENLGDFK